VHIRDLLEQRQEIGKLLRQQFFERPFGVDHETENVREHIAFWEPHFLRVDARASHDGIEQIFLVLAVHDGESARVTECAAMPSQHAVADGMKSPAPESAGIDREQVGHAIEHLARGFIREGEKKDVARVDAVLEQVSDAISEGARFARASPGDDEQRSRRRGHGSVLLLVQLARVINADRGRGRGALERVFAGHWGTTLVRGSRLFNEKFRSDKDDADDRRSLPGSGDFRAKMGAGIGGDHQSLARRWDPRRRGGENVARILLIRVIEIMEAVHKPALPL
jgi:hypothetical protein